MCVWEITLACCFSCKYCGSGGGKARENELTTQECLRVSEQLADLGCERVSLIGGEIFMRKDWDVILKSLTSRGISTCVITNGFRMTDTIIKKLIECNVESVAVSLDGMYDIHDRFRQEGSFKRAVEAIRVLAENKIPATVISTLNSVSGEHLEEFYGFLKTLPISFWQIQACSPMGNAAKYGVDYRIDFDKTLAFVAEKAKIAPFPVGVADDIGYFTRDEGYIRGDLGGLAIFPGCSAGIRGIGIDSIGNVRGCESLYDDCFIEGNLREKSLREIWEDPDAFSYNRKFTVDMLEGECAGCPHGFYCKAGCRSYNFFVNKKMYEHPFCVYRSEKRREKESAQH